MSIWGQPIVGLRYAAYRCLSDSYSGGTEQSHGIAITNYSAAESYHCWPTVVIEDRLPGSTLLSLRTVQGIFDAVGVFPLEYYHSMNDIADGMSYIIFKDAATSRIYTLSLHDALPI